MKMEKCREIENRIVAYAEGDLDPASSARVQAHLAACPACAALAAALKPSWAALDAWESPGPSPALQDKIMARAKRPSLWENILASFRKPAFAYAAAILIIGLFLGFYLLAPHIKQATTARTGDTDITVAVAAQWDRLSYLGGSTDTTSVFDPAQMDIDIPSVKDDFSEVGFREDQSFSFSSIAQDSIEEFISESSIDG